MKIRVEFEPDAIEQVEALDLWWREHRPGAASQVVDEIVRLRDLLSETPEIGVPYTWRGVQNVRWLRLQKTPYKAYYHFESGGDVVTIVCVWSGMRKQRPPLKAR
jgi:plasmid stabilization system protein ParE